MKLLETLFEGTLWNSRFVIIAAVIGSLLAGFAIFYMATVDVVNLFLHALHYADSSLTDEARKALHDSTVTHIVEVVDGYLLATVMLIFSLGLYELFISDIDQAHGSKASSKILVISSLDDLKSRLAKVILMILIVTLFQEAINMKLTTPLDLVYLGASIALIALALYLSHAAEGNAHGDEGSAQDEASEHEPAHAAPEKHGH
ncbi:MAG: YqhA family protein [Gallionella sp.]|nr:YqhA family protein [Gallionella sp.]